MTLNKGTPVHRLWTIAISQTSMLKKQINLYNNNLIWEELDQLEILIKVSLIFNYHLSENSKKRNLQELKFSNLTSHSKSAISIKNQSSIYQKLKNKKCQNQ